MNSFRKCFVSVSVSVSVSDVCVCVRARARVCVCARACPSLRTEATGDKEKPPSHATPKNPGGQEQL